MLSVLQLDVRMPAPSAGAVVPIKVKANAKESAFYGYKP